jgi:hypothetical protein
MVTDFSLIGFQRMQTALADERWSFVGQGGQDVGGATRKISTEVPV